MRKPSRNGTAAAPSRYDPYSSSWTGPVTASPMATQNRARPTTGSAPNRSGCAPDPGSADAGGRPGRRERYRPIGQGERPRLEDSEERPRSYLARHGPGYRLTSAGSSRASLQASRPGTRSDRHPSYIEERYTLGPRPRCQAPMCDDRSMRTTLTRGRRRTTSSSSAPGWPGPCSPRTSATSGGASCSSIAPRSRVPTISTHFFRGAGLVGVLDDLGILSRRPGDRVRRRSPASSATRPDRPTGHDRAAAGSG